MNRRTAIIGFGSLFTTLRASERSNYLCITQLELDAAREKAARCDWAGTVMKRFMGMAEGSLTKPIDIPERGGQWVHFYSCKKDGARLRPDSPTRHRCPACGTIYTGDPYDAVYIGMTHGRNASVMEVLALAYRFTGRREFAAKSAELLTGYSRRYLSYPIHDNGGGKDTVVAGRVGSETLTESTWVIPVALTYALIGDTLDEKDRKRVEFDLLLPAAEIIAGPSFQCLPNILCWKNSAMGCVGFAIGNDDLIAAAIDHPQWGFRALMAHNVMPGGLWSEGTLGYQHFALQGAWFLTEAARVNGIDLYANENYRAMFDAPIALTLPDGSAPGFNDNSGVPLKNWSDVYELAFARWRKKEYGGVLALGPRNNPTALLYGAESLPEGSVIPKESSLLREAGFAVLRSPQVSVAARFGKHGGGHGHPDMLNIVTYGAGQPFGQDPGSIAYSVPLQHEWYRATVAHNTVTVDQRHQLDVDGAFLSWKGDLESTSLAAQAAAYTGVTLRRDLELRGSELTDRFHCESETEHIYDWAFHAPGVLTTSVDLDPRADPLGTEHGYQHMERLKAGATDREWSVRWQNRDARLTLRIEGEPGTMIFTGEGPAKDRSTERTPFLLVRRKTSRTTFNVTHSYEKA